MDINDVPTLPSLPPKDWAAKAAVTLGLIASGSVASEDAEHASILLLAVAPQEILNDAVVARKEYDEIQTRIKDGNL